MNLWRYILYGCGQFGMMALARFFFTWILDYPDLKVGDAEGFVGDPTATIFAASVVGAVFLGFRIFDGVTDPIAGAVSDAWVRKGRLRRSLLWFSFVFPPLGLVLVFSPDGAMDPTLRWVLLTSGMFLFFVGYTFYAIPYWSLMDDYAQGDEPTRRILSNVLGAGLLLATLAGFVVSGDLIKEFGYQGAAAWFAGPAFLMMILPYFAQPPGFKAETQEESKAEEQVGAFESFKIAFKHRRFIAVLAIFAGSQMSFTVMSAAAPVIIRKLLGGDEGDLKFVMGPFLLVALPCFAFVPWVSRRFGWQKAVAAASVALGVVYIGTAFLGEPVIINETVTAGILFGLGGPMAALLLGLEGEAITACAGEAGGKVVSVYFGVFNLVIKGFNGLAIFLAGALSDLSKKPDWGNLPVRAMGVMAGSMLVIGVVTYFFVTPKTPIKTADEVQDGIAKPRGDAAPTDDAPVQDGIVEPEA